MHSVDLEKKIRLPDPTKTMEAVWRMLKRTRQQVGTSPGKATGISVSAGSTLTEKKRARIEADRKKAQGITYAMRTTIR
jgi:hypothetical protein